MFGRHPCMGSRDKRQGSDGEANTDGGPRGDLSAVRVMLALVSFFVRPRRFFVPTSNWPTRRAQPQSRLAVAARMPQATAFIGHALTAASTARGFRVRDEWSRQRRQDVILDRAVRDECGNHRITLYPVGHEGPYPNSSCTGESKAQKRRDPSERTGSVVPWMTPVTRLSWVTSAVIARGRLQARAHHGAGGNDAGGQITPQRHHQLARERHDSDPARSALEIAHPLVEPAGQFAPGLMLDPEPGKLDSDCAGAGIAGFADPLLAHNAAAVEWSSSESEIAADLATIVERAIERLVDQLLPSDHPDALKIGKHNRLGVRGTGFSRAQLGPASSLNLIDLPEHHRKPFMFAHDLRLEALGQQTPIASAHLVETGKEPSRERHHIPDALGVEQSLDSIGVCCLLLLEVFALAIEPLAILIVDCRNVHHAADPRFASQIGQQRAHDLIEIDAVGLDAPSPAIDRDARWIDLVIGHVVVSQPAMQPMRIEPRFVARDDANRLSAACGFRPGHRQSLRQR